MLFFRRIASREENLDFSMAKASCEGEVDGGGEGVLVKATEVPGLGRTVF